MEKQNHQEIVRCASVTEVFMIPLDCSWNFTISAQVVHLVLWNGNVTCCKATFVIPVITSTTIVYIIVLLLVPIYCIRCCPFNPWSETIAVQLNMVYLCFAKIRCRSCNYCVQQFKVLIQNIIQLQRTAI